MEFSKRWLRASGFAVIMIIICRAIGWIDTDIVLAALGELSVCAGFYYWKAKCDNRHKHTLKLIRELADKYGVDAALRAAEITLED